MRFLDARQYAFSMARALLGVVLLFATTLVFAQSQITTGTIEGTVADPTGAAVADAKVVIKHLATGRERTVTTDQAGRFVAPLLDVGNYQITVSAPGFGTIINSGYSLALGQTVVANISLTVAKVTETITVQGESPLVETARTEQSTLVTAQAVQSLPLNGRRFLDLAFLTPLVTQELERNQLSVAGQRGINSVINVDGADFTEPFFGGQRGGERSNAAYIISQEAVREFQLVRSGFAPEFGRSTGGVLNVITKSGSNDFHGSAFYYLRHREFAPRTVFGDDVAPIRQQFGGALGGPIRKDKTFFYTVYDQQKEHQALVIRFNSTTGLPANLLAQQGVFTSTNSVITYLAKIDHQLTRNTRVSGRYGYSRNIALNGTFTGVQSGVLDNNGTEKDNTHTGVVNFNTVISASMLNEFRWQFSFEGRPRLNNGEGPDFVSKVGPQVQITGCCFFGGVSFLPIQQTDSRLQFADNFSFVRGGHNVKVGFDFNRSHVGQTFRGNWRGVYIFNTITNFVNNLNSPSTFAADQFRIFFGNGAFDVAQKEVAAFIQDSWKVHPRLTLTAGLRYEAALYPQPTNPNPLLPQTSSIRNEIWEWQPRLGLSWDVFGNAKTVFRAFAGIFYARTPMLLLNQAFNANGNPNVGVSFTLNSTQIRQARTVHPEFVFPFVPDTSSAANSSYFTAAGIAGLKPDASFFDSDFRNPRSFNASAGIEHLLTTNFSIALEWLHSNTVHLERIRDVNLFPPTLGLDNSTPPQLRPLYNVSVRPNPNFNILRDQESSARANYDSLTLSLNKRGKKLQLLTSYTLAYSRDDDSNERNFAGIAYEDAFNLAQEYRWSREDIRQRASLSAVYDLPFGFQASTLTTWRTGVPFSAFTGVDSNKDSQFTDKPIINGVHLARNLFRQPNLFNIDFRVSKFFTIHENHKLALIFDMFNLINKHNFFYKVSLNESSTTALGSKWGTGQTPLPTFRTVHLPLGTLPNCISPKADPTLNCGGADIFSPFQLQVALKYTF